MNLSLHSSLQEWSSPSLVWLMGRTWTAVDINSAWVSSWRRKDSKERRGERKATRNKRKSLNVKMPQKSTQWHINTPSFWVLHTCTHSLALNPKPQQSQGTPVLCTVLYWRNQALVCDHLKKQTLYFQVWQPSAENLLSDWNNGRTCQTAKTSVLLIVNYFWPKCTLYEASVFLKPPPYLNSAHCSDLFWVLDINKTVWVCLLFSAQCLTTMQ